MFTYADSSRNRGALIEKLFPPASSASGSRRAMTRRRSSRRSPRNQPELTLLEARCLLHGGSLDCSVITDTIAGQSALLFQYPSVQSDDGEPDPAVPLPTAPPPSTLPATTSGVNYPLTSIPALNSLPGARASLYLNFLGDVTPSWGSYSNIVTPAYDQDGDPTTFSASELASIQQIWSYVAEDYAPFNINVTTVLPSNLSHGATEKVNIGGTGSWTGGTYGGLTYLNDFTASGIPNIAFVFAKNLANGNPKYTGDAASHESGHGFGLNHQSSYSGTTKTAEYSTGPGNGTAPLMGNSYGARRSLWWNGQSSVSSITYQDDMSVIARPANGFGYRPDTVGDTASAAAALTVSGTQVSASGVIITTSDVDYYSFTSGPGTVTFKVTVPANVNNLAPRVELRDAGGSTLIAWAGPSATDFSASITATLSAAGSYHLVVASNGGYGNVGQYFVSGTIVATSDGGGGSGGDTLTLTAPTNLAATPVSAGQVNLSWIGSASATLGYLVERSTDGVNWTTLAFNVPPLSNTFADTTAASGTTYFYRVHSVGSAGTSGPSNLASATTQPLAPGLITGNAVSSYWINVNWLDVSGATGFRVERSTDGVNWITVGTTAPHTVTFSDQTVSPATLYFYRVRAFNAGGVSNPTNPVPVTTPAVPISQPPTAPANLTATPRTPTQVDLSWNPSANNPTGYRIERSTNGRTWVTVAQVGGVTSFTDGSARRGTRYVYRVRAFNTVGFSTPGNLTRVLTPRTVVLNKVGRRALVLQRRAPVVRAQTRARAAALVHSPTLAAPRPALAAAAVDEVLLGWQPDAPTLGKNSLLAGAKRDRTA